MTGAVFTTGDGGAVCHDQTNPDAAGAMDSPPPFRRPGAAPSRGALRCAALLGLLAGALAGCRGPLVGEWRAIEVKPARSVFLIDRLQLSGDGTYSAQTVHGGIPANEAGSYEFNGFKMRFMPKAGGLHTYNANLKLDRLELWDKERRVILRKAERKAASP